VSSADKGFEVIAGRHIVRQRRNMRTERFDAAGSELEIHLLLLAKEPLRIA
jgi:hypothetical protein